MHLYLRTRLLAAKGNGRARLQPEWAAPPLRFSCPISEMTRGDVRSTNGGAGDSQRTKSTRVERLRTQSVGSLVEETEAKSRSRAEIREELEE